MELTRYLLPVCLTLLIPAEVEGVARTEAVSSDPAMVAGTLGASPVTPQHPPLHAEALLAILRTAFQDTRSLKVLHDSTIAAKDVLQRLLLGGIPMAVQVRDIINSPQDPGDHLEHFRRRGSHNSDLDITILLFLDQDRVQSFLRARSSAWVMGPLVLVSLHTTPFTRQVLVAAGEVSRVVLLLPTFTSGGHLRYNMVTYFPYNPVGARYRTKLVERETLTRHQLFLERFPDFHGQLFHLASWIDDFPYLFYDNEKKVVGIGQAMLQEIASRLNFTYHLQEIPPDEYWGELINGTWVGMLGQVVRKEKDFIINGMAVVLDRYQAADFSVPYFSDSYSITLKVPPPFPRWRSVVYPFGVWVWAGVLAALVMLSLIFHLLVRADSSPIYNNRMDVLSTMVWLSRTLLRQSVPRVPEVMGCRAFLACWWLSALVLSTSYMGKLIAFLTVPTQTRRIDTLEELAAAQVKLGNKLSLLPDYDQVLQAFDSGAGVLEATEYSQFLFITRSRSKTSYAVEEKLYPNYVGWAFQKGAPYKYIFDRYLNAMSQSGLVMQWRRSIIEDFRRSTGDKQRSATKGMLQVEEEEKQVLEPLTLENIQGAFIVLAFGSVLALLVLVIEVVVMYCG
ncbi:Glutamate receptor ionotropic, delta-2-like 17 [Homarus americanus]|uniref:Glutamate receptor ionotropic, delta-2-like 17 n=1 Tax=Homarus americanus TaxID=6706 RepID=A0A8J5T682_HOMAM|nr:Glutamate receptor ionotropic, delta-2-like 17 [Homarus americanus]